MAGLIMALVCTPLMAASAGEKTASAVPAPANAIAGKVVGTVNAASYTYVELDNGKSEVWAAAPQFAVKVGDSVVVVTRCPWQSITARR